MRFQRVLAAGAAALLLAAASAGCGRGDGSTGGHSGGVVSSGTTPTVPKGSGVPSTTPTGAGAQPDGTTTKPDAAGGAQGGGQ